MSDICSLLSVVVIGRNEGERLRRCLASVQGMQRGDWDVELIYVDSASTDDSVAIARSMGFATIPLAAGDTTAAKGRNAGWRKASGEIILFLDGDTALAERFVLDSLPEFRDAAVAVVWGHRRELYPEASIYNRVLDLDWVYRAGWTEFCGGDALFRRDALERSGGFDEGLIAGEEPELCRRLTAQGLRILHVDRAMTQHDLAVMRFNQYWRRAVRAGHAYSEVAQRFATTNNPFWSDDARRGRNRALAWIFAPVLALILSLGLRVWWPLFLMAAIAIAVVLRTAWRARWKSNNASTLLLYGIHSHLQQIPMYWGQLRYQKTRQRGSKTALLEYK